MQPPDICPNCQRSYIKYSGAGTEKIESELSRLFPQARIKKLDNAGSQIKLDDADIFVSSRSVLKENDYRFDLVGVLSIDNLLNKIDLLASQKTFTLLVGLLCLAKEKMVIQTNISSHHCFRALKHKEFDIFYETELRQRRELKFPPYAHLGLLKLRGRKENKVREISNALFSELTTAAKNKNITVMSVNPAQPAKLRGNFCWQILLRSDNAKKISRFLKTQLKNSSHSGIIVTVDIDPI